MSNPLVKRQHRECTFVDGPQLVDAVALGRWFAEAAVRAKPPLVRLPVLIEVDRGLGIAIKAILSGSTPRKQHSRSDSRTSWGARSPTICVAIVPMMRVIVVCGWRAIRVSQVR